MTLDALLLMRIVRMPHILHSYWLPVALVLALAAIANSSSTEKGKCRLSEDWQGQWFHSGYALPLTVTNQTITSKDNYFQTRTCLHNVDDKFMFLESQESQDYYKCLIILQRHPNVLQYKESPYCEEKTSLERMCSEIPGDAVLHTLFRLDAQPIECPLSGGPFTFTYSKGQGECQSPISHVNTCTDKSHLVLQYEACPDVRKTESYVEELECLGSWRESSQNYFVGKIQSKFTSSYEDSFRCFVYEQIFGSDGVLSGYKVAQSGDATCSGLTSAADGERTMKLIKDESKQKRCEFPNWLTSHLWNSLDGQRWIQMQESNTSFTVEHTAGQELNQNNEVQSLFKPGARVSCELVHEAADDHVTLLAHYAVGCKQQSLCMHVHKRKEIVMEIRAKEIRGLDVDDGRCGASMLDDVAFETFAIREGFLLEPCPRTLVGRFRAESEKIGELNGGEVGCVDPDLIEVQLDCDLPNCSNNLTCQGGWKEHDAHFLIATPSSHSPNGPRHYCFMYKLNGDLVQGYVSNESCPRGLEANALAFSATFEGPCTTDLASCGTKVLVIVSWFTIGIPVILYRFFS